MNFNIKMNIIEEACIDRNIKLIKQLLKSGADPNITIRNYTPLMIACIYRYTDMIKLLIKRGADVNATINNKTALFYAKTPEIFDLLIKNNIKFYKTYILHYLCFYGNYKLVKHIVTNYKSYLLTLPNSYGNTPIEIAYIKKHHNIVELLLENGVEMSLNIINPFYDACYTNNETDLLRYIKYISYGTLYNVLLEIIFHDRINFMKLILDMNIIDINIVIVIPILIYAIELNRNEIVDILLEYGANPNIIFNGLQPIVYAAKNNNINIISSLIEKTKPVNNINNSLSYAMYYNNIKIIKLLLKFDNNYDICELSIGYQYCCNIKIFELLYKHDKLNCNLKKFNNPELFKFFMKSKK